jgi:hypothetical protein
MIEITKYHAGKCESCKENTADYSIKGDGWGGPSRACQHCMIGIMRHNETIRAVLILQSGTRE